MITIHVRFATYGELWFDEEPPSGAKVDVIAFRQRPEPIAGRQCIAFLSLVSDLAADGEAIMASFGATNRYKVKRADSKDALTGEFIARPQRELDDFCTFYNEFAQQKMLEASYRRGLVAACEAGQLVLSAARHNDERIVWHAYIVARGIAVLLHSASHFRGKDSTERARVGRANRWLHWRDMLAFKEMGLTRYDWGGMFEDETVPEQASINNFKREFGGSAHRAYNCEVPVTLRGRAYLAARNAVDGVKSKWGRTPFF